MLPPEHEVAFITTGGQIRVRTPAVRRSRETEDRDRPLRRRRRRQRVPRNDDRIRQPVPEDRAGAVADLRDRHHRQRRHAPRAAISARYNRFMQDFLAAAASRTRVVIAGKQTGPVTDLAQNLVQNTGGIYVSIVVDSGLADRMKQIAERLARRSPHHGRPLRGGVQRRREVVAADDYREDGPRRHPVADVAAAASLVMTYASAFPNSTSNRAHAFSACGWL